ncbi:DUF4231 domain-containing protein, partial [Capnocytophaga leadbetteri]|uniref:DUF4231 domain-containing protein n=1 Tax=Capnocytophaga leadbetteri TaxID=327575 RepID=UPI003C77A2B2
GAIMSIYNFQDNNSKFYIYILSGVFLFISFILSLFLMIKKYEDIWYRGRALAESIKTLSWRYMTKSEYFDSTISDEDAKKRFISRIKEIKSEFQDIEKELSPNDLILGFITEKMEEVRSKSLDQRKTFYFKQRIQNQIDWYASKSSVNKRKYEHLFLGVVITQFLSVIYIVFLIIKPDFNFNFVGFLTTLSASFLSWLQVKKYQENKEAYITALSELNMIKIQFSEINTEEKFAKFVLDSENAMSREHTIWLAQKRL